MRSASTVARSVVGIGLVWGLLWAVLLFLVVTIVGIVHPPSIDPGESAGELVRIVAPVGVLAGLFFAGVISLARRGSPVDVGRVRAAVSGALVAGLIPPVTGAEPSQILVLGALGAISGLVSVAVARRWFAGLQESPSST